MRARTIASSVAIMVIVAGFAYAWWYDAHPPPPRHAPATASAPSAGSGAHPAPFEVFANARVGEWAAWAVVNGMPTGEIRTMRVDQISSLTPDEVVITSSGVIETPGVVALEGKTGDVVTRRDTFPRSHLTLEHLTGHYRGSWTLHDIEISDDDHEVGGRTFHCKKIVLEVDDPMIPSKRTHEEAWYSLDVPAGGLVEARETAQMPGLDFTQTLRLVGYGSADATTWGTRPPMR